MELQYRQITDKRSPVTTQVYSVVERGYGNPDIEMRLRTQPGDSGPVGTVSIGVEQSRLQDARALLEGAGFKISGVEGTSKQTLSAWIDGKGPDALIQAVTALSQPVITETGKQIYPVLDKVTAQEIIAKEGARLGLPAEEIAARKAQVGQKIDLRPQVKAKEPPPEPAAATPPPPPARTGTVRCAVIAAAC